MKLFAENQGWVTLEPRHLMASGGEGTIYGRGDDAYKVYHDQRDLSGKIRLLQGIGHAGIVAPKGILTNEQGRFVGYWMKRHSGEALPNLFANAWRQDHGFGLKESIATAEAMREIVAFVHSRGALLVDANEFNWIVAVNQAGLWRKTTDPRPMVLDIDSWQIGPYKATAIMPSIRDWGASAFSDETDWFSWAVVTFQIFTGIHPYKGAHPGFGKGNLERRMRANASVFDAGVRLNSAVRDLSGIPKGLLAWYRGVFQDGVRAAPPMQFGSASAPTLRAAYVASSDAQVSVMRLTRLGPPKAATLPDLSGIRHDRLIKMGGRLFAVVNDSDRGLVEIDESGFVKAQWPVIANATTFYRNGALSWYLGQPYLLAVGESVAIFPAPFLKTAGRILDVFTDEGRFALVLSQDRSTGSTFRHVARLDGSAWKEEARQTSEESFINAAGNGEGIVAHIPEGGELRVYSSSSPQSTVVRSALIKADMMLENLDGAIGFFEGTQGYRLQLLRGAG